MKRLRRVLRRDPFFFGLTLVFLGFCFVATGITWVNFQDPPLLIATIGFGALSMLVFWARSGKDDEQDRPPQR